VPQIANATAHGFTFSASSPGEGSVGASSLPTYTARNLALRATLVWLHRGRGGGKPAIEMKKWNIHTCGWLSTNPICRKYRVPRIQIDSPVGSLTVGARTLARFPWKVRNRWAPDGTGKSHHSDWIWLPITYRPPPQR